MAALFPDETEPKVVHGNNDIDNGHQAQLCSFRKALDDAQNYDHSVIRNLINANSDLVAHKASQKLQYLEASRVDLLRRLNVCEYALQIPRTEYLESNPIVSEQTSDREWQVGLENILGSQFDRLKEEIMIKDRDHANKDIVIRSLELQCSEIKLRLQSATEDSDREKEKINKLEEEKRELENKIQKLEKRHSMFELRIGHEIKSLKHELREKKLELNDLELRLQEANKHAIQKDKMIAKLQRDKIVLEESVRFLTREDKFVQSLEKVRKKVIDENINLKKKLRRRESEHAIDIRRHVRKYEEQMCDLKLQHSTEVASLKGQLTLKGQTLTEQGYLIKKKAMDREIKKALKEKEEVLDHVTRERDEWKSRYEELLRRLKSEGMTSGNPDSMSAFPLNTDDIQWQADISVELSTDTINCSLCDAGEKQQNESV